MSHWIIAFSVVAICISLMCIWRLFQTCKQTHWQIRWSISMLATTALGIPYTFAVVPSRLPWAILGFLISVFWVQFATLSNWNNGVPKQYLR